MDGRPRCMQRGPTNRGKDDDYEQMRYAPTEAPKCPRPRVESREKVLGRRVDALGHHDNDQAGSVHEKLTRGPAKASPICFLIGLSRKARR